MTSRFLDVMRKPNPIIVLLYVHKVRRITVNYSAEVNVICRSETEADNIDLG
jgi:hypothetical protein